MTKTEITKEIKRLQKEERKIYEKRAELVFQLRKLEEDKLRSKFKNTYHVGDIFLQNEGIFNYHCKVMTLYEILEINLSRWPSMKVREYSIHYSDGDFCSRIDKEQISEFRQLGKKISKKTFEELKQIVYNPESYETSEWNVSPKD